MHHPVDLFRSLFVFSILFGLKVVSRVFYRHELTWVGEPPAVPFGGLRLVVLLNHTSLFEVLYFANAPVSLLWQIARHGLVPAAMKTIERPFVGLLFRLVARNVVPVTRERDRTWDEFLGRIGADDLVVIAPEGRMMRQTGLDVTGRRMTVRGGIADVLETLGSGNMLLAYSGGLHHVQVPGHWPRVFKTVQLRLEQLDIAAYVKGLLDGAGKDQFKRSVKDDLERRRDLYRE